MLLITRPDPKCRAFVELCTGLGLSAYALPTIEFEPLIPRELEVISARSGMIQGLRDGLYSWLVFTSGHGVEVFSDIWRSDPSGELPVTLQIASQGSGTSRAIKQRFAGLSIIEPNAGGHTAADLLQGVIAAEERQSGIGEQKLAGKRVLIISPLKGRELLPAMLAENGAAVEVLRLYRTVPRTLRQTEADLIREFTEQNRWRDAIVVFFSPSAVRGFHLQLGSLLGEQDAAAASRALTAAAFGPTTAAEVQSRGYQLILSNTGADDESKFALALAEHLRSRRIIR